MKTKKRMISIILTLALVLSLIPAGTAFADVQDETLNLTACEDEYEDDDEEYWDDDEEYWDDDEEYWDDDDDDWYDDDDDDWYDECDWSSYSTDEHEIMYVSRSWAFDIGGKFNNEIKQVTYDQCGFTTVLLYGGGYNDFPVSENFSAIGYTGLLGKMTFNYLNNGQTLQVVYSVKNPTAADAVIGIASGADIQIGEDDDATIAPFSDKSGFKMVSNCYADKDISGNAAQLNFWCKNTKGVTDVDGYWYGPFWQYEDNYFTDMANKTTFAYDDSGCAWHWKNRTVKAGQEAEFSVMFGIGGAGSELVASGLFTTLDATKKIRLDQDPDGEIVSDFSDRTFTVKCGNKTFSAGEYYVLENAKTVSPILQFTTKGIAYIMEHSKEELSVVISGFNNDKPVIIRVDLSAVPQGAQVTFNYGYDNKTTVDYVAYGDTVTEITPARAAYDFLGWTTDSEGEQDYDFSTEVTAALTLYGQWEQNGTREPVPVPVLDDVAFNTQGVKASVFEDDPYYAENNRTVFHVGRYPVTLTLKDTDCYEWENIEEESVTVYYNVVDVVAKNNAEFVVNTEIKQSAPALSIDGFDVENAQALLSEEENAKYNAGDNIDINITMNVDVAETEIIAATGDKELVDAAAKESTGCSDPDIMYLDLSVYKTVSVNGGEPEVVQIHDTEDNMLKIFIEVPDRMWEEDKIYSVIRIHDGVPTVLGKGKANANHCVTIETNKFSTYAIACDTPEVAIGGSDESENSQADNWWTGLGEGWILKPGTEEWYFIENDSYATGWHFDKQDGNTYYMDHKTGRMCTGWFIENGNWYYLNETSTGSGWNENGTGVWQYDAETAGRPLGSLFVNEETPDGSSVNERGIRVTAE